MARLLVSCILALALLVGCGTRPENASFHLSVPDANKELKAMQSQPKRLDRPVVVIDGYLDPGLGSAVVAGWVRKLTPNEDQVVTVNLLTCTDFDACRRKIIAAVEAAFPTTDPDETCEVDVIGLSMGGLAARYAALPERVEESELAAADATAETADALTADDSNEPDLADERSFHLKRLKIARLFTLSSPHLGATMADVPTYMFISTQRDMRRGSPFLKRLNDPACSPDYPIIPYVRLADLTIGEQNAAPPGQTPIWLPKGLLDAAHAGVVMDPRIAADVSRRLRGEPTFVTEPRAPLPQ